MKSYVIQAKHGARNKPCIILDTNPRFLLVADIVDQFGHSYSNANVDLIGQTVTVKDSYECEWGSSFVFDDLVLDGTTITGLQATMNKFHGGMYLKWEPQDESLSDALAAVGIDETTLLP
jgi:hypothetical protein